MLGEVERDIIVEINTLVHSAESAAAQYSNPDAFPKHYNRALDVYEKIRELVYKYAGDERISKSFVEGLRDLYVQEFGEPDSEDAEELAKFLRSGQNAAEQSDF